MGIESRPPLFQEHAPSHAPTGDDALSGYDFVWSQLNTTTINWALGAPYQRRTFHAVGRFWIWYSDGVNLGFRTSRDGITWSAFTDVRVCNNGIKFSVAFDGENFHYVYSMCSADEDIFYRMMRANVDGTVSYLAAEQLVQNIPVTHLIDDPHIAIDSNGYPWIAYPYELIATVQVTAWVAKSSTKNGTWTHEAALFASPYQFSASTFDRNGATPVAWCAVVPLTEGKMYAIAQSDAGDAIGELDIRGRLWNAVAWEAEEEVVDGATYTVGSASISPVTYGDDVHLTFTTWNPYNTNNDNYYVKRTYGIGWSTPQLVRARVATVMQASTSIDDLGTLYCFWLDEPTANHAYYKKCVNGVWDTDPVDWFTETEVFPAGYFHTVSEKTYDGRVIFCYLSTAASPYNIKMAALSKVLV